MDGAPIPAGVGMAVCTLIGTVAGLVVGWLRDRDKLHHDTRIEKLEGQAERQSQQLADCEQRHEACDASLKSLSLELKARDDRDRADLERQIADLRKQVAG